MKKTNLEYVQNELKYAFKWMGEATQSMKKGEMSSAVYCMTVALQYWIRAQHAFDKYVTDEEAEQISWDFFTTQAMALAKEELGKEGD